MDVDNLAWDYLLPDEVAVLSEDERRARIKVQTRQVVVAEGLGNAVRAILPIRLDTGRTATLGVWLAITDEAEWDRVMDAARAGGRAWVGFTFTGLLVNVVEPWADTYLARATAMSPGVDKVANVTGSPHSLLSRVLAEVWPEHDVLHARGARDLFT